VAEVEGRDKEGVRSDMTRYATISQLGALSSNNNVNTLNTNTIILWTYYT